MTEALPAWHWIVSGPTLFMVGSVGYYVLARLTTLAWLRSKEQVENARHLDIEQ